jgi:molybdate transport system ATP-binding protein
VVGPNGAGKSSLLACLLGARPCERALVTVAGEALHTLPTSRRRLAYVPQDYGLLPHLDALGQVQFARKCAGLATTNAQILGLLAEFGLDGLAHRRVHSLSGGERQRLALARALSVQPRALLLDEPLAALDVHTRREVRRKLAARLHRMGLPALVVTHDPLDAQVLGARIAVLEAGRLTQVGSWADLVAQPQTPFVQAFVCTGA